MSPESSVEDLINTVFPDFKANFENDKWLMERAILCCRNQTVDMVNDLMCEKITWVDGVALLSFDSVGDDDQTMMYPAEYLNTLTPSGLPPHKLVLKVGMLVLCLFVFYTI